MKDELTKELVMRQRIESTMETPMTFGQYKSGEFDMDDAPPVDSAEELDWLMSLALGRCAGRRRGRAFGVAAEPRRRQPGTLGNMASHEQ
jgi:hypothetical protein